MSADGDVPALDGELIPPSRTLRRIYSTAEEIDLGGKIRAEHEAGERAAKEAVKHFRRCGDMLNKARAELPHGHFLLFLRERVKIHPRSAQRYMMLAREMAKLPSEDATRVSQMSLRDAIGELARTSARAAKLTPESLAGALKQARREPLKRALVVATNPERHPTTEPKTVDRSPVPVAAPPPPPTAPHVHSLIRALHRTIKVYLGEYQDMTRAQVLEALNEVYVTVQDGDEEERP
jgi:hypothetical protein